MNGDILPCLFCTSSHTLNQFRNDIFFSTFVFSSDNSPSSSLAYQLHMYCDLDVAAVGKICRYKISLIISLPMLRWWIGQTVTRPKALWIYAGVKPECEGDFWKNPVRSTKMSRSRGGWAKNPGVKTT